MKPTLRCWMALLSALTALCSIVLSQSKDPLLLNRAALEFARAATSSGKDPAPTAVIRLLKDAEEALGQEPVSVMQKQQVPPSGDKHDFMSLAPYWWPDTTKPDGLPYIRRDGERNPEYNTYGDNLRIDQMVNRVEILALAFTMSRKEHYAHQAILQLKVWFLNAATRMNPNLNFAQAIKGVNQGRGIGIIETYSFRRLVDAMILLQESKEWSGEFDKGIRAWFAQYLHWLLESPNGRDEANEKNNHGSAYDVQTSCIAFFLGETETAKKILSTVDTKRIAVQVEPDGSQPLELARTKSWGYSNMNLDALVELAHLGDRVGIDLWKFKTEDGRSIRKAIDFLLPYAVGEKKWTWRQIERFHPGRMYYSLSEAGRMLRDGSYIRAAGSVLDDEVRASNVMFRIHPRQ